jgi:CPA1 family monovalent cation:H+ antiporter
LATISIVLILLLAVVASGFLARMIPYAIPLPLLQVALGAVIAFATNTRVELDPEIFFVLFLPPLLFLDGWRIPKIGLFRDISTILELSLGLVIFTVVGMGFLIHWMIPAMPLAVAFALAAVISPTDPVAVSAIASKTPIPKRLMHILEGESLLNDASGLVCLRFAVAAAVTGTFSLADASLTFLYLAIGGISVGVILTIIVTRVKMWVARHFGEESGTQILISLLIPFGAYIIAEHLHCSGILAAVAAGITMSYAEATGQALAATRVRRNVVWDTVQFAANGIIFVILGEQLPGIAEEAAHIVKETGHHEAWWLGVYVVAIVTGLLAMRFVWVWVSFRITMFRKKQQPPAYMMRIVAASSVAGIKGAITLAGILTLPLVLNDGTPLPARDLAIFLAAGVIILSIMIASFALPRLLNGLEISPDAIHEAEEDFARVSAAHAAIKAIELAQHDMAEGRPDADLYVDVSARVMELYRHRLDTHMEEDERAREEFRKINEIEQAMRLIALKAERDEIFRLGRSRKIEDDVMRKLVREIDILEGQYSS